MATAASTSPYVQSEGITTSNMPLSTIGPFDDGLFGPTLDLSDYLQIASYGIDPTCNFFTPPDIYYHSPGPLSESDVSAETFSSVPNTIELASPTRTHSSHSAFHPCTPELPQPRSEDGLGIASVYRTPASSPQPHQTPVASSSPQTFPPPRRYYPPIAPNPVGLRQLQASKRSLSRDDDTESPSKKRKVSESASPAVAFELSEEDSFLLRLKDDEGMSWKDISNRFQNDLGKTVQIPALQMRLKRLRERLRVWTEMDIQALRMAHDYWLNNKFEIIASKMADFGAVEKWSAKQCERKWQKVGFTHEGTVFGQLARTPTFSTSYTSSPIEGSPHGFFPFLSTS